MQPTEHQLIIEMFKQQTLLYAGLIETLKSRGLLERSDLDAFDALVSASSREFLEQRIEDDYRRIGTTLGVTGLPQF
jgi:hypothetical protein